MSQVPPPPRDPLPLTFDDRGLVTVVAQDALTGEIRMVAHANAEAVAATLATGRAVFYSRSRRELWEKGKTSGHALRVERVLVDCDADCLIYSVTPSGPSCHTGAPSCFFRRLGPESAGANSLAVQTLLGRLEDELEARKASTAGASYTKSLYDGGAPRIGDKIREEAGSSPRPSPRRTRSGSRARPPICSTTRWWDSAFGASPSAASSRP